MVVARRQTPPGAGKTMLAERLPGLLPALTEEQALAVTAIHSVLGVLPDGGELVTRPPFVAPHHSASTAAVIGGGSRAIHPGAVSRAHHGVLFLDESVRALQWFGMAVVVASLAVVVLERPAAEPREVGEPVPT